MKGICFSKREDTTPQSEAKKNAQFYRPVLNDDSTEVSEAYLDIYQRSKMEFCLRKGWIQKVWTLEEKVITTLQQTLIIQSYIRAAYLKFKSRVVLVIRFSLVNIF